MHKGKGRPVVSHLAENLLWFFFNNAEALTFLLAWILFPVVFLFCFFAWKKVSVPVPVVKAVPTIQVPEPTPVVLSETKAAEPIANKNEANA